MNVIEIKELTKTYGNSRGINDINLSVQEGEVFGFIGPNGAGKSTTIRSLLGLLRPDSGSALIFGKSCAADPGVLMDVGYLPSEVFYYEGMRVIDLLKYSSSFYKKDCSKRIVALADIMELDLKKRIDDLSFGNKKKVGIVQGLLHEPKLIILDEPTSGLDPLMQQKFFDLLRDENKKGATIFFSSHILSEVQRMCGRVAIIKDGSIIKIEKLEDLRQGSCRRIRLETAKPACKNDFQIEGAGNIKADGHSVSLLYKGDINRAVKALAAVDITSLWVEEPDLEEIFMHYYAREEAGV